MTQNFFFAFSRDAAILNLAYFKPVNDHVVDTMHALCSGKLYMQL